MRRRRPRAGAVTLLAPARPAARAHLTLIGLAALALALAIGGDQLVDRDRAPGVARLWLSPVEAAFDFDLNELPPDEDENGNERASHDDELTAADELDQDPARLLAAADGGVAESTGPSPMEGVDHDASQPPASRGVARSIWSSVKQKLPKYFDFGEFARKFKRSYKAAEASLRRSLFVAKCVEIFKSRVAFRMGKTSYLQAVNKFADQSRDEMALMFMPAPPPELAAKNGQLKRESRLFEQNYVRELTERKRLLEQPDTERALAMDVDTQGMFGEDDETRAQRELDAFYTREESRVYSQEEERAMARALEEELKGLGMETMTQGMGQGGSSAHNLPWPGQLKSADAMELDHEEEAHQKQAQIKYQPPVARLLESGSNSLDWSQHECFHQVYDQGSKCGQCYVMATTALAEFYKCSEGGPERPVSQRKFSKNYVLSCAQRFTPTVMGCAGGSPLDTLRFISRAGIWNIRSWVQKRLVALRELRTAGELEMSDELTLQCPLDPARTPYEQWGSIQIEMNPRVVGANEWLEALSDGPLVASVQLPPDGVDSFAGGVHDGRGCATSGLWHAMILVGYGLGERGEPYWRFRNSFGPDWGDQGHFNLAMRVPDECLAGGVRVYREPLDS